MSETIVFEKQCDCVGASASGPRVVVIGTRYDNHPRTTSGQLSVQVEYTALACDKCHKPWARGEHSTP